MRIERLQNPGNAFVSIVGRIFLVNIEVINPQSIISGIEEAHALINSPFLHGRLAYIQIPLMLPVIETPERVFL
jgi:hypothetical protein